MQDDAFWFLLFISLGGDGDGAGDGVGYGEGEVSNDAKSSKGIVVVVYHEMNMFIK